MTEKFSIYKDADRYHIIQTIAGQDYSCDDFATHKEAQQWINDYFAPDGDESFYELQYAHACGYYD